MTTFETHDCSEAKRLRSENHQGWVVDRQRKVSQDMCIACGQKWDRPKGLEEYFMWSEGYRAAKGDITNIVMSHLEPSQSDFV